MRYEIREDPDSYDLRNMIVRVEDDGSEEIVGYDGGEPEDNLFTRDYDWVYEELNKLADEINEFRSKSNNHNG